MSEVMLVYSLFPNAGEAHDACRTLLDEKLIACANRLPPAVSYFRFNGEIDTTEEHPVIFKTSAERVDALIARIAALHRYKVPAILAWPAAAAHAPFAAWVDAETRA
jgi:periplasmic divalent cation tolerance protein